MKTTEIPKGVKFSFIMMSFPLLCTTTYLGLLAPMVSAGTGIVDPASFAYLARTCLSLLALNISFTVRTIISQWALGWYSLWTSISNLWDCSLWWGTKANQIPNALQLRSSSNGFLLHLLPSLCRTNYPPGSRLLLYRSNDNLTPHSSSWP